MPKVLRQEIKPITIKVCGEEHGFIPGTSISKVIEQTRLQAKCEGYDEWEVRWWDFCEGWCVTFGKVGSNNTGLRIEWEERQAQRQADKTASSSPA